MYVWPAKKKKKDRVREKGGGYKKGKWELGGSGKVRWLRQGETGLSFGYFFSLLLLCPPLTQLLLL